MNKKRLQLEGFAENGFKSGMKEIVGDEKLIITKCNCNSNDSHTAGQ